MRTDENNNRHLIASEGKVFRRISDKWIAGIEIYLGYTYYLFGEKLAIPLLELPEHYEEIDKSMVPDTGSLLSEDKVLEDKVEYVGGNNNEKALVETEHKRVVTIADYEDLENQVAILKESIKKILNKQPGNS